jgi:hypothetical protein
VLPNCNRWLHGNQEWDTSTIGRAVISIGGSKVLYKEDTSRREDSSRSEMKDIGQF